MCVGGNSARIDNRINTTSLNLSAVDAKKGINHADGKRGDGHRHGERVELELHVDTW